ncbi:uncharacterized protein [Macrobrachium rosenbergii]|uniref:uncharacterized protein n=1 Tax=Macrobrachium rosenbergii TaxID=79674 RepID=UPI0034D48DDA
MDPAPATEDSFIPRNLLQDMIDEVICPVMRLILTWVTPGWDQTKYNFIEYMEYNEKISKEDIKKLNKKLTEQQNKAITEDQEGKTWDTTLICLLLRNCGGLAKEGEQAWSRENGEAPERLITELKDKRNELTHEKARFSKEDFMTKTEELRVNVINVLESVGKGCSHVEEEEIKEHTKEFNWRITKIRDEESMFQRKKEYVKKEGKPVLIKHLNRITTFNPLLLIFDETKGHEVAVKDIFTGMMLEEDNKQRAKVSLEDIIAIASNTNPKGFILLKGYAGVGKTTILKKITSDWVQKAGYIKGLDSFDLLLYAEFRDRTETFLEILQHSLGHVHQCFNNKDFVQVVLGLKNLVILDGYDEINSSSSKLFQEILYLAKHHKNLTVIVTTRPEAEKQLARKLGMRNVNAVHVWLVGIEVDKGRSL